ncbi:MAG: hypothetical protein ACOYKZ_03095 [Chlamydiia bacterium]
MSSSVPSFSGQAVQYAKVLDGYYASFEFRKWRQVKAAYIAVVDSLDAPSRIALKSHPEIASLHSKVVKKLGREKPVSGEPATKEAVIQLAKELSALYPLVEQLKIVVGGQEMGYFDPATRFKHAVKKPFVNALKKFARATKKMDGLGKTANLVYQRSLVLSGMVKVGFFDVEHLTMKKIDARINEIWNSPEEQRKKKSKAVGSSSEF